MKQRIIYTVLIGVLSANIFLGAKLYLNSAESDDRNDVYRNMVNFTRVLEQVRQHYVDADKVFYPDLIDGALKGMLSRLDPHSEYMDPKRFQTMQTDTRGEFGGIGIVVSMRDGVLTIVSPMDDSPSAKAGLLSGDQIIAIKGKTTERITLPEAVELLRGPVGQKITFTVRRPSTNVRRDVTLARAIITVSTVRDINLKGEFKLIDEKYKIGYLRVNQFGERTADELEAALRKLDAQRVKGLVIDLRDNPGGLLDQSVQVAEKFLPKGKLIVSTEGRNPSDTRRHLADSPTKVRSYPIIILVNRGSASASEIVAGCFKDYKRAELVGELTFGKGSVQSILQMQNGAALRLTTAKYYTPSHKQIHGRGVGPDHKVVHTLEQRRDLSVKRATGGLDALEAEERLRVEKVQDDQLNKAVELLTAKLETAVKAADNK